MATLVACGSDRPNHGAEEQRAGTLTLPLRTVSNTGVVYFLRNATFQLFNQDTGEVTIVSSEDDLSDRSEIVVRLKSGFYSITLFNGWFLERFGGGGGSAGSSSGGFGGEAPVPSFGGAVEVEPDDDPASSGGDGNEGGSLVAGSGPIGGKGPIGGSGPVGGSGPIGGEIVTDARLVSDATQFFFLDPQGEAFVNYSFRVGPDVIEFNRGNLHITIDVDDKPLCEPPDGTTFVERTLLETNAQAVGGVSLAAVFKALATNGDHAGDAVTLYQQIFDSYATADQARLPNAIHCGDEMTDGDTTLNGYHIDCNRVEAAHVDDMDAFFATAFVNRMDLAPANGAHCGQQRMIFANNNGGGAKFGRTFMILEAQIPNPSPELGIQGCRPLAQFWVDQSTIGDASVRGQRLQQAFLFGGAPGLENFPAFYTAENLTVGSGQIRTNQFDQGPWTLREFKLAVDPEGNVRAVPFPVAESPFGGLWDETNPLPQGDACRQNFLSALDGVLTDDLSLMSFVVDSACKDAESRNDFFTEDYASNLQNSPNFQDALRSRLEQLGSSLTPFDVANRARFSGSCIGCHNEAQFSSLGNGLFAPRSDDFPQVLEFQTACGDNKNDSCFATSSALRDVFLPGRLRALGTLVPVTPNPCVPGGGGSGGGGFGGDSGVGGDSGTGNTSSTGGSPSSGGVAGRGGMGGPVKPVPTPTPAPVIDLELPSSDEPVEILQEVDQEIRDEYGEVTISGKSAKSTH
jgi:hypothetical protein